MKILIILLIITYQKFISSLLKNMLGAKVFCRSNPSCSEFSKQSVMKYGVLKGVYLSIKRIFFCRA